MGVSSLATAWRRVTTQKTVSGRLAFETALVIAGASSVALFAAVLDPVLGDHAVAYYMLSLTSAGIGAIAVCLGATAGRLSGNRRGAWLIPALAIYSAFVLPCTATPPFSPVEVVSPNWGAPVAYLTIAVLLLAAIRPPGRVGTRLPWIVAAVGTLLALVAREAGQLSAVVPSSFVYPNAGAFIGWAVLSTALVAAGYRAESPPVWRVGLAFAVISGAHLYALEMARFGVAAELAFSAIRLWGLVVVLLGMAQLLRRALRLVLDERSTHQEELRITTIQAEQEARLTAEREHELRNGLSGLSGMARMFPLAPDGDHARTRSVVLCELQRLRSLLEGCDRGPSGIYVLSDVLDDLVELWRGTGMNIDVEAPPGLLAVGRRQVLAQVLTNLITNCVRHAPGSPVRVGAARAEGRIVVAVRDEGPGMPDHVRRALEAEHGDGAGMTRIGLALSRQLVREEGGALRVHGPDGWRAGCVVSFDVPAASPARRAAQQSHRAATHERAGSLTRR